MPIGTTVDDLAEDYLAWYKMHRAKTTHREVCYVFRGVISNILGKVRVMEFGPQHVTLFKKMRLAHRVYDRKEDKHKMSNRTVSNRTVNLELDYFSGFLKWCRREKGLEMTPPAIDKLPYKRPIPIVLSPGEIVRILDAADPFHRAFILCLYSLGLRFSEARNMRWEDIDFENKSVRVIQKGGSYKMLPLNDWVETAILAIRPEDPEDENVPVCPWVFESRRNKGRPINNINKALALITKAAKIEKHVNPHLFRHSCATHMMGNDINLRTIQEYLGHAQVSTTEFYTHVVMGNMRKAATDTFRDLSTKI